MVLGPEKDASELEREAFNKIDKAQQRAFVMIWRTKNFRFPGGYPAHFDMDLVAGSLSRSTGKPDYPSNHPLHKEVTESDLAAAAKWKKSRQVWSENFSENMKIPMGSHEIYLATMILSDNPNTVTVKAEYKMKTDGLSAPTNLNTLIRTLDLWWLFTGGKRPRFWADAKFHDVAWCEAHLKDYTVDISKAWGAKPPWAGPPYDLNMNTMFKSNEPSNEPDKPLDKPSEFEQVPSPSDMWEDEVAPQVVGDGYWQKYAAEPEKRYTDEVERGLAFISTNLELESENQRLKKDLLYWNALAQVRELRVKRSESELAESRAQVAELKERLGE